MPRRIPMAVPQVSVDAITAGVWAYVTRRLTSLAIPTDIVKFVGKGTGTEVPADKSLYDLIALDRLDKYLNKGAGTELPADKSLYDIMLENPLLDRLTEERGNLLDNLLSEEPTGTIVHPSGVGETDALEITPSELMEYPILLLDVNALTQNTTIRTYIKINAVDYRLVNSAVFPTDFPSNAKGVPIVLYPMSVAWKISLQSAVAEGVSRNIPYRYVRRSLA